MAPMLDYTATIGLRGGVSSAPGSESSRNAGEKMTIPQQNALELALQQAADEPAYRPAFFKLLLTSTVYVLGKAGEGWIAGAARQDDPAQSIELEHWEKTDGATAIPFFTSLEAL